MFRDHSGPSATNSEEVSRRREAAAKSTAGSRRRKASAIYSRSLDGRDRPRADSAELLIILAAMADEKIPLQTIAPKFSGCFNKGVDYVGEVAQFEREMALDVAVIAYAVRQYGLPENLKLSVHSGSDKFSIYPAVHSTMKRFNAGVHLKTAGTTWLEELIGLAEPEGWPGSVQGDLFRGLRAREELCAPYASVIDIDPAKLPSASEVRAGRRSNILPLCATFREQRRSTAVFDNCCTSRSRSRLRWDGAISTCWTATKT